MTLHPRPTVTVGLTRTVLPVVALLILWGLLVFSVQMKSPTLDEQNHLARGLAFLKTGDLRLSQEHPPGINAWAAWPLLLDSRVRLPLDSPSWLNGEWYGFADLLLWQLNDRPQTMIFATRVPIMWLTLTLAAVAYRWAGRLGGRWAACCTLALVVLDPNLLAHGRLTTTDMGVTVLALAAMWAVWRATVVPSWGRWAAAGLLFGALQLTKFSALVLGPAVLLVILFAGWCEMRAGHPTAARLGSRWALRLGLFMGLAALVVWAGYRFSWGPIALWGGRSGPAPAYWAGIETIFRRTTAGNPAFLLGQYSQTGWWTYFPVAFAVKTPLPALILLAAALIVWGARRLGRGTAAPVLPPVAALCLLLPVLAFGGAAIFSSFNIGYRHLLPVLPFLYILTGVQAGDWIERQTVRRGWPAAGVEVLVFWLAVETAMIAPHYLAYFNQLAGGPDGGYRVLVDSNLDWGQDLPGLKRYVDRHGLEPVYLSWFGAAHPEAYDLQFRPLPGFWRFRGAPAAFGFNPLAPAPGVYAISVSNLQGVALADPNLYAWFREREPEARIGHSIWIYQVPGAPQTAEAMVLAVQMDQLDEAARAVLAGGASVRQFDPQTGMIILAASQTWYALPRAPEWGRVVYESGDYALVEGAPAPMAADLLDVQFGQAIRLSAYRLDDRSLSEENVLEVTAQWLVLAPPHRAAVSFAHLLDGQGRYVAGWDGLTAPATCWQQGDLIQQIYRIPLPADLPSGVYRIELGWYDATTGERWPCQVDGSPSGDRFLLPLEIEL